MELILNDYSSILFNKLDDYEKKLFKINFEKELTNIKKNNIINKNKEIKILIGSPAVGKTSYINQQKTKLNNFFILESDNFRWHLKERFKQNINDYGCITNNYSFLFFDMLLDFLIKNDYNLICSFSFTNSYIWFLELIETLKNLNYNIEILILEKEANLLIENNDERYNKEFIQNGFGRKVEKDKILKSIENINLLKKELSNLNLKYLLI